MMNQSLHVLLHRGSRRRGNLVVLNLDGAGGHLVKALVDDAKGLTELLHSAQVAIVTVAVYTNGDVELYLVVCIIWLRFTNVPGYAGAAKHYAGEGVVQCVGGTDNAYALRASDPDSVVSQEFFSFVDAVAELCCPLVDVVE